MLFWIHVSIFFHPLYLVVLSKPTPAACQLVLFRLVRQEPTWIRTRAFVRWDSVGLRGTPWDGLLDAEPCLALSGQALKKETTQAQLELSRALFEDWEAPIATACA